jgi:hypothetical protein
VLVVCLLVYPSGVIVYIKSSRRILEKCMFKLVVNFWPLNFRSVRSKQTSLTDMVNLLDYKDHTIYQVMVFFF